MYVSLSCLSLYIVVFNSITLEVYLEGSFVSKSNGLFLGIGPNGVWWQAWALPEISYI